MLGGIGKMFLLLFVFISVSSALDVRHVVFVISSQENDFNMKLAEHLKNDIIFQSGIVFNEVLVGHSLHDEEATIIHHFNFHEDPKAFKYPNLGPGFGVTIPILERIVKQLKENDIFISNFSIDVAYELAKYIFNYGCKAALVKHEPSLCSSYSPYCASFPSRLLACDKMVPRNNIFFAVKTCEQFHHDRVPIVQKTWGKHVPLIKFFSDKEDSSIPTIDAGDSGAKSGYCLKTIAIMKYIANIIEKNDTDIKWIVIADDDTILGINALQKVLSCYDYNKKMAIGERYGYEMREPFGYNYITGGAGMVFSKPLLLEIIKNCRCPSENSPDDMYLGYCISKMGVQVTHVPGFHQARPNDYPAAYLDTHDAVSFHKHWMIDPIKVYQEWFEKSDNTENYLLESKTVNKEEL
ncbi:beta-1,3-glucosyltransferase isoform X2 [Leptinotarsa decemlineata]|uniref:beta-1,3-glucosyltransferase isoform X2 n=1 Tax=Leptinotarsa decemlineata TaxID=7539 RepID=UPI003D308C6C